MKKQLMGLTEEIEMSIRTQGFTKRNMKSYLQTDQIPKQAYHTVYQLLRDDFSIKKYKKTEIYNPGLLYFNPLTFKMGMWNFAVILTCYFLQLQISFTLAFGPSFWKNQLQHLIYFSAYVFLVVFLALDIFVNFHKGYYAFGFGKVIENKQLIIKRYLKFHFGLDLACIILLGVPLFYSSYTLNFLQIISIILLFVRKFRCQTQIVRSLQYHANIQIFFVIAMLGCDVMQLGNFGACIFLGIDLLLWRLQYFGNDPQYYWLSNNSSYSSVDLMSGPWIAQYVYAQSFSTGTLSTLAPGPFGKNPIQISYELFVMIFFMILASYVGQVLVSILYANDQTRIFHQNNIQKFDDYMKLKKVLNSIKSRVQNFFELIWEFEIKLNTEKEQQLIHSMPVSIRQDLLMQTGFTKQISFLNFFSSDSEELQKLISYKIVSNIADPDATIFQIGSGFGGYIYFIKSGLAKFYFPFHQKENTISLSNIQRLLGQYQFITGISFAYCCKSIDLCIIQKLSTNDLIAIIKSLGLSEQFHILKCETLIYESLKNLNQTCLICDSLHRQDKCPVLYISKNIQKELSCQQSIYTACTKDHKRIKWKRRQYKQPNACRIRKDQTNQIIMKFEMTRRLKTNMNKAIQFFSSDEISQYWKYYADFNIY